MNRTAALYALVSAALFGISTPAAKSLVGAIDPIVLAGLLYCGAGIGVAMLRRVGHAFRAPADREQSLRRQDIPWLAGAIAAGGIAGPILLMTGLARTDAAAASLLLTLEGAATALMAWCVGFDETECEVDRSAAAWEDGSIFTLSNLKSFAESCGLAVTEVASEDRVAIKETTTLFERLYGKFEPKPKIEKLIRQGFFSLSTHAYATELPAMFPPTQAGRTDVQ